MQRYDWLIEVRPFLEKQKLKRAIHDLTTKPQPRPDGHTLLGLRHVARVPHLTLVYNFRPKVDALELMNKIRRIASRFSKLPFEYDGWELKETPRGYALAFGIQASPELRTFRREMYEAVRDAIESEPRVRRFNESSLEDYWFHAAVAFQMGPEETKRVESVLGRLRPLRFASDVWRVTLLRAGKIVLEYDSFLDQVLTRREALSRKFKETELRRYRKSVGIDVKTPLYRGDGDPRNIWLISDTHFGHRNIIGHTARPFVDIGEMDEVLRQNWNNTVANEDVVFCLGDVVWNGIPPDPAAMQRTQRLVGQLNGRKFFIHGNHDPEGFGEGGGFLERSGIKFELRHSPEDRTDPTAWLIHGDKHNNDLRRYPFISHANKTVNACAEVVGYRPVSIDTIVELISEGRDLPTLPLTGVEESGRERRQEVLPGSERQIRMGSVPHERSQIVRRRGTAIVETPAGVLVIAGERGLFLLPGGGAQRGETRMRAAIRELKEETGLVANGCKFLFSYDDPDDGRRVRNLHKVFLIDAEGEPRRKSHESRYIGYWKPSLGLNLSGTTRRLLERYFELKHA